MRYLSQLGLWVLLAGCGDTLDQDVTLVCEDSTLSWETAAAPFINNYCRGCHSRDLSTDMRAGSPSEVNFDSKEDIILHLHSILERIEDRSMPPVGNPDLRSESAFLEWASCQKSP